MCVALPRFYYNLREILLSACWLILLRADDINVTTVTVPAGGALESSRAGSVLVGTGFFRWLMNSPVCVICGLFLTTEHPPR